MSDGKQFTVRLYVPDDPLTEGDAVILRVIGPRVGQRTRSYGDTTKTREQLVTQALGQLRQYVLSTNGA